jgi:thioesterase domain-containing protein
VQWAWGKLGANLANWHEDAHYLLYKANQPNGGALSTQLRALDVVQMANRRALSAYKLRTYPGRVTLFRAQDPDDGYEYAADNGWTEFAMGGIQIHEIPGEHQLIFAQPNVRTLAEKLDACTRAALAENIRG